MTGGEIRSYCQCPLGFGPRRLMIAAPDERKGKARAGFCIATIERDGAPRRRFFRALSFRATACPERGPCAVERGGKARVSPREEWIEIDGLLKDFSARTLSPAPPLLRCHKPRW